MKAIAKTKLAAPAVPRPSRLVMIRRESYATAVRDAYLLIRAHADEVGLTRRSIKFKPALNEYGRAEKMGALIWISVREGKKLVGYAMYLLVPSLMFEGNVIAILEAVYLTPETRRRPRVAKRLFDLGEHECRQMGASAITLSAWAHRYKPDGTRVKFDTLSLSLERMGYKPEQTCFWKFLE